MRRHDRRAALDLLQYLVVRAKVFAELLQNSRRARVHRIRIAVEHSAPRRRDPFITVLSCQLVQAIRTRLRQAHENASWTTLRRVVQGQQASPAHAGSPPRAGGRTLHMRRATRAEPTRQAVYKAVDINPVPGGTRAQSILM